jgi:hypothetical protein
MQKIDQMAVSLFNSSMSPSLKVFTNALIASLPANQAAFAYRSSARDK